MEDLLKLLIEPLVSDIKKVKIKKNQNDERLNYTIFTPKNDIAKVIGKNGKMIKSIKNLVRVRSIKENIFANVEVEEA